jgi:preprotein translocase subunit SecY
MKRFWKTLVISGLFITVLNLVPELCSAQIGDPGEDPDAPIDGGVTLLVAAGVGYGIKKVRDSRKKSHSVQITESMK